MSHRELVEMLAETGAHLVSTVVAMEPDDWERPGLGEWSMRELVGHTLRAFSTIDAFLDHPLDDVAVDDAGSYYRIALGSLPGVHDQVAQRGREAGVALGADPAAAVVDQLSGTLARLGATTGAEIGRSVVGGMRLDDYLETRLVELVVHYSDICAALAVPVADLGAAGVRAAATVLASAAPADLDLVLRAALGRAQLPAGFTVWP